MRYAAPTPASINRLLSAVFRRVYRLRNPHARGTNPGPAPTAPGPLDAAYVELYEALAPLSTDWGTHGSGVLGLVTGPFERIARASNTDYHIYASSASRDKNISLLPVTTLVVKGMRHARLVGRLDGAFAGRVSCTFARWSMGGMLDASKFGQYENGWFGDDKLCDAIREPREGRQRLQFLFQGPLAQGAVMLVAVTDPNWVRFARTHDMFCGDAFFAGGLDASVKISLDKIAPNRKPASGGIDGALERLASRYPAVADLYRAMDGFGLVKPTKVRNARPPRFEYQQLDTARCVLYHLHDGMTELAKSVEVLVYCNGKVYGNEHSFDNVLKWDRNWPLATKLEGLLGRSIDTFALAPLEQEGAIVDKGCHAGQFYPLGALVESPGGSRSKKPRNAGP